MSAIAKGLLAAALCVGLRAGEDVGSRIAVLEQTMDRFYRGEPLEEAVDRSNRAIQAYNEHALAFQARSEQERTMVQERIKALEKKREQLATIDKHLKQVAGDLSREETQERIRTRNDLARQINEETEQAGKATEAFNARAARLMADLEAERKRARDLQAVVNQRLAAFDAFTKAGQDVAFFRELNALLAEVRSVLRSGPPIGGLREQLSTIRGLRRELADWAIRAQSRRPNGLIIVEALLGDEPCWLVLDTGAMDTVISEELLRAAGAGFAPHEEKSLSVIGGLRVPGFACRIPRLTVAGQSLADVPGSAVPASDVGVDGLLGQSFLRSFTYTVDDRRPGTVVLTRK